MACVHKKNVAQLLQIRCQLQIGHRKFASLVPKMGKLSLLKAHSRSNHLVSTRGYSGELILAIVIGLGTLKN